VDGDRPDPEHLRAEIFRLRDKVAPRLPDIDPGDLLLILECIVRKPGSGRRFFIRELRPGVYVY
jgi:hypothetical protein